jgi:hypothetical protein
MKLMIMSLYEDISVALFPILRLFSICGNLAFLTHLVAVSLYIGYTQTSNHLVRVLIILHS